MYAIQDLLRSSPPQDIDKTLLGICSLAPKLADRVLQNFNRRLDVEFDSRTKLYFVAGDYNRHGNSFRSPWTNQYYPSPPPDFVGDFPPDHLRALEVEWNEKLDIYRNAYYDGGVSSAYIWDSCDDSITGVFQIHKEAQHYPDFKEAIWDATHVVEIRTQKGSVYYRVTSNVLFSLLVEDDEVGVVDIGTNLTKQHEQQRKLSAAENPKQISTIGMMIEELENIIRKTLQRVYVGKLREVLDSLRFTARSDAKDAYVSLQSTTAAEIKSAAACNEL